MCNRIGPPGNRCLPSSVTDRVHEFYSSRRPHARGGGEDISGTASEQSFFRTDTDEGNSRKRQTVADGIQGEVRVS